MPPVDGQHVGVELGALDGPVSQQPADVFERPPVQQQMDRKRVPEGVGADGKRRPADARHQGVDMAVDGLAGHGKEPLVGPKPPRAQVAGDPVLEQAVGDGHVALGRALKRRLGGPARALLEGLQDHPEVVAVVDEAPAFQRQDLGDPRAGGPHQIEDQAPGGVLLGAEQGEDLGFYEVARHGVDGLQHRGALGDEAVPVDAHRLQGECPC